LAPTVKGDLETVKVLLKANANANATASLLNFTKVTALHIAAEVGHTKIVKVLLDAGAEVDARTSNDTTPLHQAAQEGHLDIVRELLIAGADLDARDDNGTTPHDFALHCGHEESALELGLVRAVGLQSAGLLPRVGGSETKSQGILPASPTPIDNNMSTTSAKQKSKKRHVITKILGKLRGH
jgi:ankyrin repeat protein